MTFKNVRVNWKTTVVGIATAFFGFIVFDPSQFQSQPWLVSLAKYAMIGGFAAFGIVAKDGNVTGGSVPAPTIPNPPVLPPPDKPAVKP